MMLQWWILQLFYIFCTSFYGAIALRHSVRLNPDDGHCNSEILSLRYVADDQFTASSFLVQKQNYTASDSRLLNIHSMSDSADGRAWCPGSLVYKQLKEWIQVDFHRMTIVNQIYTTGRGNGNYPEFTPQIVIKYQRYNDGPWKTYRRNNQSELVINTDSRTPIRSALQAIIAKKIRIYPLSPNDGPKQVCLRFGFLGCFMHDEATSYSGPQGDTITIGNLSVDLRDDVYDGQISGTLRAGLGLLMDNYAWEKNFFFSEAIKEKKMDVFTGWSCQRRGKHSVINITFDFQQEREFHSLSLYTAKDIQYRIYMIGMVVVSIGSNGHFSSIIHNISNDFQATPNFYGFHVPISLKRLKGNTVIVGLHCGLDNIILLSEVEISSTLPPIIGTNVAARPGQPSIHDSSNSTDRHTTSLFPDYQSKDTYWRKQDITVITLVILACLMIIFIFSVVVVYCKFQRSRRNQLAKKLELVAQSNSQSFCHPNPVNVYTIQPKTPNVTKISQPKFFPDCKTVYTTTYSGSQPSEGVYASWPNTDEDADLATLDKEEEKCLLSADMGDQVSVKEYATYQCGMNCSAAPADYIITDGSMFRPPIKSRPPSIVTTIPCISTLSVPLLKMNSYDIPKSPPIVTYKTTKKHAPSCLESSYQHFLNYRGSCGDVEYRYQLSYCRVDPSNLESNIRVIPIPSLLPIQTIIRGEFGSISIWKMITDSDSKSATCFFVKAINADSKSSTKSSFIMDLKIFNSINCANIAKLEAIAIDGEMTSTDLLGIIKSTRFYILVDYLNGYNLKDFLRNTYYSNVSQELKSTQTIPYSQISVSSLLIIITQVANGMKHMEDLGLTHRDLACRNCIIDLRMHVKIYPGGWLTAKPNEDYCSMELMNHLVMFPLRWMAPESIIGGLFSIKSDVWSFAVTMWEIFTLCSLIPYGSLTNEALLDLMSHKNNSPRLPCPQSCPKEIFDLMIQCWNWDEPLRPKFSEIYKFLQFKNTTVTSQAQIFLPAPPPDEKKC